MITHVQKKNIKKQWQYFFLSFILVFFVHIMVPEHVWAFGISPGKVDIGPVLKSTTTSLVFTVSSGQEPEIVGIELLPQGLGSTALLGGEKSIIVPLQNRDSVTVNIGFDPRQIEVGRYEPKLIARPIFTDAPGSSNVATVPEITVSISYDVVVSPVVSLSSSLVSLRSDSPTSTYIRSRLENKGTSPLSIYGFSLQFNDATSTFLLTKPFLVLPKQAVRLEDNVVVDPQRMLRDTPTALLWLTENGSIDFFGTIDVEIPDYLSSSSEEYALYDILNVSIFIAVGLMSFGVIIVYAQYINKRRNKI
jgi:hypothetical protein